MVWPAASDCSTVLLSASRNVQPSEAVLTVSVLFSFTAVIAKLPILAAPAPLPSAKPGRSAVALVDFRANEAVWVSIRSTSWNVIVPEVPIVPRTICFLGHPARRRRRRRHDRRNVIGADHGDRHLSGRS